MTTAQLSLRPADLLRVLKDLLRAELKARSGVEYTDAQAAAWTDETLLGSSELELDSLELVSIAGRVNELFHLHESGIEDFLLRDRTLGDWVRIVIRGREIAGDQFTFLTSGSTGSPKPCVHPVAALDQEVDALAAMFAGVERVVSFVPTHHIFGFLFTAMLPARLQASVIDARAVASNAVGWSPTDLIVGVPSSYTYLARSAAPLAGARAVVSTSAIDAPTIAALREKGLGQLTEVYGSSETGGLAVRLNCAGPFTLHPFWRLVPTSNGSLLQRVMPDGTFAAPVVCMDHLRPVASGFELGGRIDHAVKIAGTNVFPRRIEALLREHPLIADASVRLMRPAEGERLKAFVVPRQGAITEPSTEESLKSQLSQWSREQLTAPEHPKTWTFGPAIPRDQLGKAADW